MQVGLLERVTTSLPRAFFYFSPVLSFFLSPPFFSPSPHDLILSVLNSAPFPCYSFFPLTTQFLPLLLTIFPFLSQLYLSVSFLSFGGGRFLFHPFSQPPLEVNESRRLSSFTRHRFHVGRRRAANRVNSSPLVERESVFPFHRGGSNSSGEQATRFIHIHPVAASYSALTQSAILGVRVSSLLPYLFRSLE